MSWVLIAVTVWTALGLGLALLIGRSIQLAKRLEGVEAQSIVPDFFPAECAASTTEPR